MWFNVFMYVLHVFYKNEKKNIFCVFYLQINALTSIV